MKRNNNFAVINTKSSFIFSTKAVVEGFSNSLLFIFKS